ncbi:MAG: ribonuclease Z [Candidatus Pristimantibacillus lignocellulolyticus]|uniref:Ribonuclease Z n=1 Tax=Candidatus Pristimantibacillus lignocellulolyticus TaxID=2994561 RepID=A0A9J6ZIF3_9BACL|nr:MAG: ribonuclease Z [Candidatus Pristimantibacillus lignocellulolyticus]
MELYFLGTSAGMPIRGRNVTSIALRVSQYNGSFWMFDCGEGTQHQLLHTSLKLSRLNKLFITHLHGDHVYGLPGLLSSRSSLGGTDALHIYGPQGLHELLETNLRLTETHLNYPLHIVEINEGMLFEDDEVMVEAAKLDHRIDCFGYRIMEHERKGALNASWLAEMGVPAGPAYGQLKAGNDITLEDGRVIRSADAVGKPLPGHIITILGDTRPCDNAVKLGEDADVLIHEATFAHDLAEKAYEYGHSTALQAAEIAYAAKAKKLFITHFSSRYQLEDLAHLEMEARSIFSNTEAAIELRPYTILL